MITHRFDTILGDIPSDWSTIQLKDALLDHNAGDWGDDNGEVECKVLRSTNFTKNGPLSFDDVATRYLSESSAAKLDLKQHDILLERSGGGPSQPVGRVGFIEEDLPGYAFSNFVQRLRPNPEVLTPDYLGWLLFELNRSGIVERLQHQTTQMRNLEYRDYLRIYLPKPSGDEQIAIAKAVSMAELAISRAKGEFTSVCRLKTALMQQLFTKGIPGRHKQFESTKLGELPRQWNLKRLKQCGKLTTGGTPDRNNRSFYDGNLLWVKSGEVNYNLISNTEEKITKEACDLIGGMFPEGTLLIAMYGAGVTRGRVALLSKPACVNQAIACFNPTIKNISNGYLFYWFQRNYERIRAFAGGSNQDNLSGYLLKNLYVPMPDIDEQEGIATILRDADNAIIAIQGKLLSIDNLKMSLLQNLLTGKVRIKTEATS